MSLFQQQHVIRLFIHPACSQLSIHCWLLELLLLCQNIFSRIRSALSAKVTSCCLHNLHCVGDVSDYEPRHRSHDIIPCASSWMQNDWSSIVHPVPRLKYLELSYTPTPPCVFVTVFQYRANFTFTLRMRELDRWRICKSRFPGAKLN